MAFVTKSETGPGLRPAFTQRAHSVPLSASRMKTLTRRDLLVCLSLANVSLMEIWRRIAFADQFFMPMWSWRDLVAVAVALVVLTGLFAAVVWLGRSTPLRRIAFGRWIFLVPLLVLANLIRHQFPDWTSRALHEPNVYTYALVAAVVVLALVVRRRRTGNAAEVAALCLLPFVPLMLFHAFWVVVHEPARPSLAPRLHASSPAATRVVWIVFDEADWRYIDPLTRPAGLQLPELDRLMSQSVWAEHAVQSGLQTGTAIPSLIFGRPVEIAQLHSAARLVTADEQMRPVDWLRESTVFSWARSQGLDTSIDGWYIPYCRLLAPVLSDCYWEPMDTRVRGFEPSLATSLGTVFRSLSPLEDRQRHLLRYRRLMRESATDASDPALGLVLLHLAMPHEPVIYDRHSGRLTVWNFREDWYLDNLALGDRSIGELRRAMERAGVWDRTTVIVTSDHALRWYTGWNEESSPYIPYLVKLPGQARGMEYQNQFHTQVTRELIQDCLLGRIRTPSELAAWLDQRSKPPASQAVPVRMPIPGLH